MAIGKANPAYKQDEDVAAANAKVVGITSKIAAIQAVLEAWIVEISESLDPASLPLQSESIKPAKADVKVQIGARLRLQHDARGENAW